MIDSSAHPFTLYPSLRRIVSRVIPERLKAEIGGRIPVSARSVSRDALFLTIERGLSLVLGFAVSVVVIRHLGSERYGLFAYVTTWVFVLGPLANLGLSDALMRIIVRSPENASQAISTILTVRIVAAVATAILFVGLFAAGAIVNSEDDSGQIVRIAMICSLQFIAQALDPFDSYNQANNRITTSTIARILVLLIVSPLRLGAALLDRDVSAFAWLVVFQVLLSYAIIYRGVVPQLLRPRLVFNTKLARLALGMGALIVVAGMLNMFQARAEMYFLERIRGFAAVGMYSVGLRFVELFDVFGTIAVTIYLPRLIAATNTEAATDQQLTQTYRLALLLYLAILPLIIAMAVIANFLLGSRFPNIHWLILSMAYRPLLTFIGLTRAMYMLADNNLRYGVLCSLSGLVIAVITAPIFITRIGVYGAAVSALLSYLFANLLIDAFFNRRYFKAFLLAFRFR